MSALLLAKGLLALGLAASPGAPAERTRVVLLGVEHSAQLVAETQRPSLFRAFFERASPIPRANPAPRLRPGDAVLESSAPLPADRAPRCP